MPDKSNEEIERLAQNPEEASELMAQLVIGKPHMKIVNAVNDIKEKYDAILKLNQVFIIP